MHYLKTAPAEASVDLTMREKVGLWTEMSKRGCGWLDPPRSALISHSYLLSNPPRQPCTARDLLAEAVLLTKGYISITQGSEADDQLICLINPSFSKKNIGS